MSPQTAVGTRRATIDDLMRAEGKAELINGKVVEYMATGDRPASVALQILVALHSYARLHGGRVYGDNAGYVVPELASGRESFSPDVSYHTGPRPANPMNFLPGAPVLAVEVRSKNDYKSSALLEHAQKRADYFSAGTLVVWDVDPVAGVVLSHAADASGSPRRFAAGDIADAEPALPEWRVAVDRIMPPGRTG